MNPVNVAPTVRVLYVGGMGRSGSTLMERLIGQLPGVCNLGEVVYLAERGIRANERCGCGEPFHDCPFWTKVGELAFGGWGTVDLGRLDELQRTVDDVKFTPRLLLPRSTTDFDRRRASYTDHFRRIYAAAAEVSGATVIVDSSKKTSLAYALSHEPGIELRLLHLVRDPRGVAYSWTQLVRRPEITDRDAYMPRYKATYMALLWNGHNALLAALRLRGVRTSVLKYEQFIADPCGALTTVSRLLDQSDPELDFVAPDATSVTLLQTHSVAGNPMRFQTGQVLLRRDDRWRSSFPAMQRVLVGALTSPVAAGFGYRPWGGIRQDPATEPPAAVRVTRLPSMPATRIESWPSVTAVVPSHGRPELLRRAVRSILDQDYPGALDVVIVHDREPIDVSLPLEFGGRVRTIGNDRAPGLCGARNTGILRAEAELVAFCDDDDQWRPVKLRRQVQRLLADPPAVMAATAMRVEFAGKRSVRTAGLNSVDYEQLLLSRMSMLHSSSFLIRRSALLGEVGLLDEQVPGSMGEDWDLLLRAARIHPIAVVDEPLVDILWGSTSFFSRDWRTRLAANDWFLQRYPEIGQHSVGVARLTGQSAFFAAASGQRRDALRYVGRTLRRNFREPRAWLALPVIAVPRLGTSMMAALHRTGRGI